MFDESERKTLRKALQSMGKAEWKDIFAEVYGFYELRLKSGKLRKRTVRDYGLSLRMIKDGKEWIRNENTLNPHVTLFLTEGVDLGGEEKSPDFTPPPFPLAWKALNELAEDFEKAEVIFRHFSRKVFIVTSRTEREKEEELFLIKIRDGDLEEVWSSSQFSPPVDYIAGEFQQKLEERKEARVLPAEGQYFFYMAPGEGGLLFHELVGHMLELDNLLAKKSLLRKEDLGSKIFSEDLTVYSISELPDDDGTAPARVKVLEKGKVKKFFSSRLTSLLTGHPLTCSSRRERYFFSPVVFSGNLYVEGGKYEPLELLAEMQKGIYVMEFKGGKVNVATGWAYFKVQRAFWIERGKPKYPLKPFMMAISFQQFNDSLELETDPRKDKGGLFCHKGEQVFNYTIQSPGYRVVAYGVNLE